MEPDPYSEEGRLAHVTAAAKLASEVETSPPEFNRVMIEFLDTVAAWVLRFHPNVDPIDFPSIGDSLDAPAGTDARRQSRHRLQILADALASVIESHRRGAELDTEPLLKVPIICDVFDCNPDGARGEYDAADRLAHLYYESKCVLDVFQRRHALACTQEQKASAVADENTEPEPKQQAKEPKLTVNDRILRLVTKDWDKYIDWTAETWGDYLEAGPSTVRGTVAWKRIMEMRESRKQETLRRQSAIKAGMVV